MIRYAIPAWFYFSAKDEADARGILRWVGGDFRVHDNDEAIVYLDDGQESFNPDSIELLIEDQER